VGRGWGQFSQVSSDNVLQDRTLSARLATDDCYLREIDRVVDADRGENILKFVHEPRCQSSVLVFRESCDPCQVERGREGQAYLMSWGSEMPPGWLSVPPARSVVIVKFCNSSCSLDSSCCSCSGLGLYWETDDCEGWVSRKTWQV